MNIGIQIEALVSLHKDRGIGTYTSLLLESLRKFDKKNNYITVTLDSNLDNLDIVHFTYVDFFQRTLRVDASIKTVITIHDVIPLKFKDHFPVGIRGSFNLFLQKREIQKADAVITDSHASKRDIISILSIPSKKIYPIHLAPLSSFMETLQPKKEDVRSKYSIQKRFIMYVGDVNWNKNVSGLIEAFRKVNGTIKDLQLVLVGKSFLDINIPETRVIHKLIEDKKLASSIIKIGYIPVEDLAALYNTTALYVQPSFCEGFGLPVLEAMNCGSTVAVSNTSSLPEIVGDAGLYFDPTKTEDIAKNILQALTMPVSDKENLKRKSLQQAANFSQQKFAQETIYVYESVFNQKQF